MQPLSAIVQQVCSRLQLSHIDPAKCQLFHNKKPLDLNVPARLANLPAGAKLELQTGNAFLCCKRPAALIHEGSTSSDLTGSNVLLQAHSKADCGKTRKYKSMAMTGILAASPVEAG